MGDEGEEKMLIVNVVECEHGAAVQQELRGKGLEAQVFQRDTKRRLGAAGEDGGWDQDEQPGETGAEETARRRDVPGNQHGDWRVSLHYRSRVGVMFHRRRTCGNVCRM